MTFIERLRAAADAMLGKIPAQKGYANPYFWGSFIKNYNGSVSSKNDLNYMKLRQLSETAVPRRAIRFIKTQVSRLDCSIELRSGQKATAKQKQIMDALNNVLNSPNGEDDWSSFCEKMIEDLLVVGWTTVVVKDWAEHPDHPLLLFPSDAASFQIYTDWDGNPNSRKYAQFNRNGEMVDFKPSELFVIKYDSRASDPFGLSPMAVCAQEVEWLLNAMAYAGSVASTAHPKKLLHLGEDADPEFVKEVRMYFEDEIEGRNAMAIMGGTKSPSSIELGASNDESLFLKHQERLITLVSSTFGLDAQKFGILSAMTKSTGDSLDSVTDDSAIRPMAHMIESAINNYFLRKFGIFEVAEFKFRYTTSQNDVKALAVLHQLRLQDDSMTINESRIEMGNAPLPYDKDLKKSPGDMTLSEYRAWVEAKYGAIAAASVQVEQANMKAILMDNQAANGGPVPVPNADQQTKAQQGANGVHGASGAPKLDPHAGTPMAKDIAKKT
jgi:hypothetical protein